VAQFVWKSVKSMLPENITKEYIDILKEELILATGCTEPIAIAYCAAKLRAVLGTIPTKITARLSGNILKNVKSVVVPNTSGLKGVKAAIAAGVVAGRADCQLQVITDVPQQKHAEIALYIEKAKIEIECMETPYLLDISLTGKAGNDTATVRIVNHHTNIVHIEKNGEVQLDLPLTISAEDHLKDKSVLNVKDIVAFAGEVDTALLASILDRQIQLNSAIAEEGLRGDWGANIGSILLADHTGDIGKEAAAYTAAGSDARMSGCELPVVILSGSGNQGMTASLPVIYYAKHIGATREQLHRALAVSNLVTIHQKTGIGRLSAYCGAISAGVGAGAGIAFLLGGDYDMIAHTVVNAVAILSGTICDGAKPSCAAKIAAAVDAGILGYQMYQHQQQFYSGDGIVTKGVDKTIANIGVLAREGMEKTDKTILHIMMKS